jgi:hypothetical protein
VDALCQGRLIWIEVPDKNGYNAYARPVAILTADSEIEAEDVIVGVVCSHTSAEVYPRKDTWIELPYQREGRTRTKLRKPTVALCEWIEPFQKVAAQAAEMGGIVPPGVLLRIIALVKEIHDKKG